MPLLERVLSMIIPRSGTKKMPMTVAIIVSLTKSPFFSPRAEPASRLVADSPMYQAV